MVKRNIRFYERRKKILQKQDLCTKEKVHIIKFLDKGNVDIMDFWEMGNSGIFLSQKVDGKMIFTCSF